MKNLPIAANEILREAARYAVVGALNTLIGIGVFSLCVYFLRLDPGLSNAASYAIGLVNSFVWNRKWTFKSQEKPARQVAPFLAVFAFSFLAQYLVFTVMKDLFHLEPIQAYLLGMVVYTVSGYSGNKLLTFRKPQGSPE